jgi:hypothetical protein
MFGAAEEEEEGVVQQLLTAVHDRAVCMTLAPSAPHPPPPHRSAEDANPNYP